MGKKKRINTTFDNELWTLLYIEYGNRRVEILEDMARELLFGEDNIDTLRDEIVQDEIQLNAKKERLKRLEEIKEKNDNNQKLINKAMETVKVMSENQAHTIGENQIEGISRVNGLSFKVLKKEVQKRDEIKILKVFEPPK